MSARHLLSVLLLLLFAGAAQCQQVTVAATSAPVISVDKKGGVSLSWIVSGRVSKPDMIRAELLLVVTWYDANSGLPHSSEHVLKSDVFKADFRKDWKLPVKTLADFPAPAGTVRPRCHYRVNVLSDGLLIARAESGEVAGKETKK